MSQLFYEITGRSPRKRRMCPVLTPTSQPKIRRATIYPHSVTVSFVMGCDDRLALWGIRTSHRLSCSAFSVSISASW